MMTKLILGASDAKYYDWFSGMQEKASSICMFLLSYDLQLRNIKQDLLALA